MRKPASSIKEVTIGHRRNRITADRTSVALPISEEISEREASVVFCHQKTKSDAKCIRSAAVNRCQLIESVFFFWVEANRGCCDRHNGER